jgi:hypothetical protein
MIHGRIEIEMLILDFGGVLSDNTDFAYARSENDSDVNLRSITLIKIMNCARARYQNYET